MHWEVSYWLLVIWVSVILYLVLAQPMLTTSSKSGQLIQMIIILAHLTNKAEMYWEVTLVGGNLYCQCSVAVSTLLLSAHCYHGEVYDALHQVYHQEHR